MTNEQTIEAVMKSARARITSENAIPVTVARMPAEEVAALLDEIERLKDCLTDSGCDLQALKAGPGEWIEWKGGDVAPVSDGTLVMIRNRKGEEWSRHATPDLDWSHITKYPLWSDIVAYRVLP